MHALYTHYKRKLNPRSVYIYSYTFIFMKFLQYNEKQRLYMCGFINQCSYTVNSLFDSMLCVLLQPIVQLSQQYLSIVSVHHYNDIVHYVAVHIENDTSSVNNMLPVVILLQALLCEPIQCSQTFILCIINSVSFSTRLLLPAQLVACIYIIKFNCNSRLATIIILSEVMF